MPTWSHMTLRQQMIADGALMISDCALSCCLLSEEISLQKSDPDFYEDRCLAASKLFDELLIRGTVLLPTDDYPLISLWRELSLRSEWEGGFPEVGIRYTLYREPRVDVIRFLRLYYGINRKLITGYSKETLEAATDAWMDRNARMRQIRIQTDHPVLRIAQQLLGTMLKYLDLRHITPGHGPGAVAEGIKHEEKYEFSTWPKSAERLYPYGSFGVVSLTHALAKKKAVKLVPSCTRAIFVAKEVGKPRLISAEPCAMQYLQQGQMRRMMQYIAGHRILSRCLPLRDRKVQQLRAWEASMADDESIATVDFSNASDTVSATLVWYLLQGVPSVRRHLWATRSSKMSFGKRGKYNISAFAPMGSAVCFPIESLVFWALAVASVQVTRYGTTRKRVSKETMLSVTVFGDDVILPSDALPTFEGTATDLGMEFNTQKTCFSTPFRESCGAEWFSGLDVTVVRNRHLRNNRKLRISDLPALTQLQRRLFALQMYQSASFLRDLCDKIAPLPVLSINRYVQRWTRQRRMSALEIEESQLDQFPVLLAHYDENVGRGSRWNKKLQRLEVKMPMVHYAMRQWTSPGFGRLLARLLGDASEEFLLPAFAKKVKWKWTPIAPNFRAAARRLTTTRLPEDKVK